ncbi:MAG TPA: hypothetical protein VLO07_01455 [Thermoanaerobaculia bacterium]|nr:hypothetical protein [Thermoanaerobaculia bacterium]
MNARAAVALLLILTAGVTGCATTRDSSADLRVLDAVVVGREFEPAGGVAMDPRGMPSWREESGTWYLVFEARDGEATARYRLAVTRQQYMRFSEGADVQITLVGYQLRDVRRRT